MLQESLTKRRSADDVPFSAAELVAIEEGLQAGLPIAKICKEKLDSIPVRTFYYRLDKSNKFIDVRRGLAEKKIAE